MTHDSLTPLTHKTCILVALRHCCKTLQKHPCAHAQSHIMHETCWLHDCFNIRKLRKRFNDKLHDVVMGERILLFNLKKKQCCVKINMPGAFLQDNILVSWVGQGG